jgi:hypothetical protein
MQFVKHAVSPLDKEAPGLGTHFSKQCSLTFYIIVRVEFMMMGKEKSLTSINCRALFMAASCFTWVISLSFTEELSILKAPIVKLDYRALVVCGKECAIQ